MTRIQRRRFFVKWLLQISICLCCVIVAANNSTQNDQVKTNSYTAALMSTTTVPSILMSSTDKEVVNDPRVIPAMIGMIDGKEKNWSFKKKGLLGTHNVDIKIPAKESFFCRLLKRQSVVMLSFCMQGGGWGWKSEDSGGKKKGKKKKGKKKKGKKKKKKKGGGGGKKKGGGGGGGKKKGGGGGGKKKGGKKKGGDMQQGWGQMEMKGWESQEKEKEKEGWKEEKEEEENEGWGAEEEEEPEGWQADPKGEGEDFGATSQDDDYKPKKNYKGKNKGTTSKPGVIKSAVTVSTSYLSEFDLNKWENSEDVKGKPEDILHHHFYSKRQNG